MQRMKLNRTGSRVLLVTVVESGFSQFKVKNIFHNFLNTFQNIELFRNFSRPKIIQLSKPITFFLVKLKTNRFLEASFTLNNFRT